MEFLKAVQHLNELINEDEYVITVDHSMLTKKMEVLVKSDKFKEVAEIYNIDPLNIHVDVRSGEFNRKLSFYKGGVCFVAVMREQEYYDRYEQWIELPFTDEELDAESNVTTYERKLKESGHKQHDFM